MSNEREKKEDARRLLKWITENNHKWQLICQAMSPNELLIADEYKQVLQTLKDQSLYQLIILMVYLNNSYVVNAVQNTILKDADNWDDDKIDSFIEGIITHITIK